MKKKVVVIMLLCVFALFTACKKQNSNDQKVSENVSSAQEVTKVDYKVNGISENDELYSKGEKANYLAGSHTKAGTATCVDCHGDNGVEQPSNMLRLNNVTSPLGVTKHVSDSCEQQRAESSVSQSALRRVTINTILK